jgi:hypothetical protein
MTGRLSLSPRIYICEKVVQEDTPCFGHGPCTHTGVAFDTPLLRSYVTSFLTLSPEKRDDAEEQWKKENYNVFNVKIRYGKVICRGRATGFPWVSSISSREYYSVEVAIA